MSTNNEPTAQPEWLQAAFSARGFSQLTPIQEAVLSPACAGRDLRLASATGSGKTAALAITLAEGLVEDVNAAPEEGVTPGPKVLVVAPTRELAAQLQKELSELFRSLKLQVALVIGGGSYRDEARALRRVPAVLVATPGRLVDYLRRGGISLGQARAVALDEADQLLELGFKDELEEILAACPKKRRTVLVSATFNGPVRKLADKHQQNPYVVQGTPVGAPHKDIEHIVHVIHGRDQLGAITNLLLEEGDSRCLMFMTTRNQVTEFVGMLGERNFRVGGLSGEMSQAERVRTLEAFRRGNIRVLVATDVAARGIDVQDVRMVIHAFPPRDAEALIHRSGRTGRAGQQGRSIQLVTPNDLGRLQRLFATSGLKASIAPVPGADEIFAKHDALVVESVVEDQGEVSTRRRQLAETLLSKVDPAELVGRLLGKMQQQLPCAPANVSAVEPRRPRQQGPRGSLHSLSDADNGYASFELNYGLRQGATAQRIMAMVCRRGNVSRRFVGHIEIGDASTRVDIAGHAANSFERAAGRRDPRDREIHIRPVGGSRGPANRGQAKRGPSGSSSYGAGRSSNTGRNHYERSQPGSNSAQNREDGPKGSPSDSRRRFEGPPRSAGAPNKGRPSHPRGHRGGGLKRPARRSDTSSAT